MYYKKQKIFGNYELIKVIVPLYLHIEDIEKMDKGDSGTGFFLPPNKEEYIKCPPEAFLPGRKEDINRDSITVCFIPE